MIIWQQTLTALCNVKYTCERHRKFIYLLKHFQILKDLNKKSNYFITNGNQLLRHSMLILVTGKDFISLKEQNLWLKNKVVLNWARFWQSRREGILSDQVRTNFAILLKRRTRPARTVHILMLLEEEKLPHTENDMSPHLRRRTRREVIIMQILPQTD